VTFLIMNTADGKQTLDNNIFQAQGIAQKYNCQLVHLDFQQESGLNSSLPLGHNQIEIQRGLTTSSTAIFVPFTTQELFQPAPALYYGLNALSNNLLMADRRKLNTPKGLYYKRTEEQYITKATIIFLFTLSELKRKRVPQKSLKQC